MLSQEAYILLYAKQGIPWFSTAIEVQKPCADPGISDSSPKSVLDDIDFASNLEVEKSANCSANETKDVADRASTQFSCDVYSHRQVQLVSLFLICIIYFSFDSKFLFPL